MKFKSTHLFFTLALSVFSLVPDLLFECSHVLEYAKIRTVLQSRLSVLSGLKLYVKLETLHLSGKCPGKVREIQKPLTVATMLFHIFETFSRISASVDRRFRNQIDRRVLKPHRASEKELSLVDSVLLTTPLSFVTFIFCMYSIRTVENENNNNRQLIYSE